MLSPTILVKNTELDIKPINFTIIDNGTTNVFIVIFLEVG